MTGVVPPGGPTQPAPSAPTPATVPVDADIEAVPPRLSDVPRSVALPGTVVETGRSPDGGAVSRIRTAAGEVVVRTETPLPPGPVTVQIPPDRPPTQATVLLPSGPNTAPTPQALGSGLPSPTTAPPPATTVSLASAGSGQALPPSPISVAGSVAPPPTLALLLPGMSVRALSLPSLTGGIPGGATLPAVSGPTAGGAVTGASLGLPIAPAPGGLPTSPATAVSGVAPTGSASPPTTLPTTAPPGTSVPGAATPGAGAGVPGPVATGLAPGSTPTGLTTGPAAVPSVVGSAAAAGPTGAAPGYPALPTTGAVPPASVPGAGTPAAEGPLVGPVGVGTVRVLAIGDGPVRPPVGNGPVAVATVTGTLVGGQPVVSTDKGLLILQAHPGLPAGTRLTLEAVVPPTPSTLPPLAPIDPLGTRDWPGLQHALDALGQTDPQAARALGAAVVPQLNARLATNMALFMGIVRGGIDPRAWLGERGAKALEAAGRAEVIDRLSDDVRRLRDTVEGGSAEWRTYPLPLLVDGTMDRVVVRVRRHEDGGEGEGDGADRKGGGTRFLVDVNLSRLGPLQLDGLVRPKRLDLIIRSRDALPDGMRTELRQIFAGSLAELRLAGDLGFQSGRGVPWVPLPVPATAGRGVLA